MKELSYYMIASAMLLAYSCQEYRTDDEAVPARTGYRKTITAGVASDARTRVGFDENNSFYWHKGDKIGVVTSAGFKEMTLDDSYHGRPSGVFYGDFVEDIGNYAVYPYGAHSMTDGQLVYVLPPSYAYESIAEEERSFNPPMAGKIDEGNATLYHLASFIQIRVENIPAGGSDMKFVFTADKRITGEFAVDLEAETPVILADDGEGNTVTINFSNSVPGNHGVFHVPVPLGEYGSLKAEIVDGNEILVSKTWENQTVSRKTPKRGNLMSDHVAEIEGRPYMTLQEAVNAADNQTIVLVADVDVDLPLVFPQGKTAVLDLNGFTLSETATSAAASSLITVRRGTDLTIMNGTLTYAATTPDTQWGEDGLPDYPGYANNTIRNEGTLTVENAVLENRTKKGGASYVIDNYNGAKLTVNDGSVITQTGGDIAIRMFNGSAGAIDVTVNGGVITGYRAVWIQLASTSTSVAPFMNLTVTGGTLASADPTYQQAVYSYSYGNDMKNVLINISGGTFDGDVALTGGANKTNIETVNISGGTFTGPWNIYSYGADDKAAEAIRITGGTFSYDPTEYLAAGYDAEQTDDGWIVSAVK